MRLDVVTEETGPGRWVATGGGCRREGRTEEEALAALRIAVFESRRWAGSGYARVQRATMIRTRPDPLAGGGGAQAAVTASTARNG